MTKPTKTEEQWVDIIREWNKHEPYPPIRPLAKKIEKALTKQRNDLIKELSRFPTIGGHSINNRDEEYISLDQAIKTINDTKRLSRESN